MKQLLFIVLGFFSFAGTAQALDTIYANENHNTALFFPTKVRQGIVGSPNYVFSYSEEKPQYFGLLKAIPGTSSNLLVLTQDGQIYSYVLSYRDNLSSFNYFINADESLGNEVPVAEIPAIVLEDSLKALPGEDTLSRENMEGRAEYYLRRSEGMIRGRRKKGLKLEVKDLFYFKDEVHMVLTLENKSGISFEPDYLKVYVSSGNKKRNSSFQRLIKEPIYEHKSPELVLNHQQKKFVLVFSKFTLGENEKLEIEVREKKGNRQLRMRFRPARGDLKK